MAEKMKLFGESIVTAKEWNKVYEDMYKTQVRQNYGYVGVLKDEIYWAKTKKGVLLQMKKEAKGDG